MVKIEKMNRDSEYDSFCISTKEGSFYISFENNFDLYWGYWPTEGMLNSSDTKEFTISKENEFMYNCLDDLYKSVEERKPYRNTCFFDSKMRNEVDKYANLPYENENIVWRSDDYQYEEASRLIIKREEQDFKIIFKKGKTYYERLTFFIRICNSGSRYTPYEYPFMDMYRKLQEYNLEKNDTKKEKVLKK